MASGEIDLWKKEIPKAIARNATKCCSTSGWAWRETIKAIYNTIAKAHANNCLGFKKGKTTALHATAGPATYSTSKSTANILFQSTNSRPIFLISLLRATPSPPAQSWTNQRPVKWIPVNATLLLLAERYLSVFSPLHKRIQTRYMWHVPCFKKNTRNSRNLQFKFPKLHQKNPMAAFPSYKVWIQNRKIWKTCSWITFWSSPKHIKRSNLNSKYQLHKRATTKFRFKKRR